MTGSGGGSGGGMGGRSSLEGNMSSRGAGPGGYSGSGGGPSGHGTATTQAERNYMSSQMSFWSAFGTGGYPDEPSLMEELEVNLPHIWQKSTTVLNPLHRYSANHQRDAHMMDDTDLAGPLLFCFVFGALLFLVGDDCVCDVRNRWGPLEVLTLACPSLSNQYRPASPTLGTSTASLCLVPSPSTCSSTQCPKTASTHTES